MILPELNKDNSGQLLAKADNLLEDDASHQGLIAKYGNNLPGKILLQHKQTIQPITTQQISLLQRQQSSQMDFQIEKDIGKLNDAFRFERTLQTSHLLAAIVSPDKGSKNIRAELFSLLQKPLIGMNIYMGLKWLLFVHQAMQMLHQLNTLEFLGDLLINKLSNIKTSHKFQEYLLIRLYNPYRNYLLKSIMRKYNHLELTDRLNLHHQMENYSNYNFVNYAVKQLASAVRQFTPYFEQQYPCLNLYIELIDEDVKAIYRKVLHVFEEHLLQRVSFIEIQRLGIEIKIFAQPNRIKRIQTATADHSSSSNQNKKRSPNEKIEVTPFFNLQNSQVCLTSLPKP